MSKSIYGDIIVNNKAKATDQLFTYSIPQKFIDKAKIGSKVIVPFGNNNKLLDGYILNLKKETNLNNIKTIIHVFDDDFSLTHDQVELCKWLRNSYLCTYFDAIQCVVPPGIKIKKNKVYCLNENININKRKNLTSVEEKIIESLKEHGTLTREKLSDICKRKIDDEIDNLEENNFIKTKVDFSLQANIRYKKIIKVNVTKEEFDKKIKEEIKKASKQIKVLKTLLENKIDKIELKELQNRVKVTTSVIKSLEKKGLITIYEVEKYRSPIKINSSQISNDSITLNDEQLKAYITIKKSILKEEYNAYLLHGITGSGKTEIYIKLVSDMLKLGKQAIILVPEISLTTQLLSKFVKKFGDNVAVLHSKLSIGERFDQWRRIKNEEVSIVIGARSAVFAPCKNLGLIIIDEEHETSYKSETHPKYHTREVAEYRCKTSNATLILGTATPSIESYYKTQKNYYYLLKIEKRFNNNPLPSVEIIDMRKELENGNRSVFSNSLYNYMKYSLSQNKQIILFLNRRGYSTFISCRSCGYVVKCKNCDISMTYHQSNDILKCHYCGFKQKVPVICPKCSSKYIKHFGTGTEKIEALVKRIFPKAVTQRLDVDTTSNKGELERIITSFEQRKIDILIGTQMIAKGLDFPYVTLVGVLSADTSLNLPDFRSNERTFQLLTQVAGRAGRHKFAGKVVIQTYTPDNYAILASQNHDYDIFYKKEITLRKEFFYPPFCEMVNILLFGQREDEVIKTAHNLFYQLKTYIRKKVQSKIEILGPSPAIYNKIKGSYRWQILIKYQSVDQDEIKGIINYICDTNKNKIIPRNINISFDINPYNIF